MWGTSRGVGSPLMFNLNVKDLPNVTKFTKPYQFADDSVLLKVISCIIDVNNLQSDINDLNNWCLEKNLKLNPSKFEHMGFTFKNVKYLPKYIINNKKYQL